MRGEGTVWMILSLGAFRESLFLALEVEPCFFISWEDVMWVGKSLLGRNDDWAVVLVDCLGRVFSSMLKVFLAWGKNCSVSLLIAACVRTGISSFMDWDCLTWKSGWVFSTASVLIGCSYISLWDDSFFVRFGALTLISYFEEFLFSGEDGSEERLGLD